MSKPVVDVIRTELTDKELMIMYANMKDTLDNCECGGDYNVCAGCMLTLKLKEMDDNE